MRASSVVMLPYAPSSVAVARRRLSSELLASGVYESVVDDASVIISELLSNALRHARPLPSGQVRLSWSRKDDMIELSVSDGGANTEPRRGPGTLSSLGGRGLGIVEALAEGWGVRHDEGTTTVWAVLRAPKTADRDSSDPASLPSFEGFDFDEFGELTDERENEPAYRQDDPRGASSRQAYPA
ncbi:ATP-binding protein [Actinomadura sp. SCN-SB]|uniref:ATP-binding protein n=1 Tax=Actinomadura sp. SCN-SB TaxID=3373092 RepID=UPI0037504AA8